MNTVGYFEIQSSDPAREIEFYKKVFGWKFTQQYFTQMEYYRIQTNGIEGGLLKRPFKTPEIESATNAFICSIQVEDYDKTHQLIIDNGGLVVLAKFAVRGRCWQGYYIDRDNNAFGIFQVDENAQ